MPTHRHNLNCMRDGCGRPFSSRRSDALYCSRRCRRGKSPAALAAPPVDEAPAAAVEAEEAEDLGGWRRMPGGFLIPPFDERNVIHTDWPR
jgi:hypothetical protein